jgi:hypothetical protein
MGDIGGNCSDGDGRPASSEPFGAVNAADFS